MGDLRFGTAQGRWVVAASVLGSALAAIDATVVGIALPAIGRDFEVGLAPLQWVVNGYLLALAGLLLVGGSLGDRYGRRRIFLVGVVWFASASTLCGIAPNAEFLVGARALQGVGAAMLVPGSLSILQSSFAAGDRARAIGAWTAFSGVATAAGPFIGGWLVGSVSWRWIFLINLPIAAVVAVVARRHVPESCNRDLHGRPDFVGGALVTAGLVGVVYGLIAGPTAGWSSPAVLGAVLVGAVLLLAFVAWENWAPAPTLPLGIFSSRQFSAANAVTFVIYGALGGSLFLLPIQLQQVAGFSPLAAGTSLLPLTIIMLLLSARAGALAVRIGPRLQMSVGPIVAALGLALLVRIDSGANYVTDVLPGVVLLGLGLATCVAPLTATTLEAAPSEFAGAASAVNNDVARTAGLVAVALLPALAGLSGNAYLEPSVFDRGFQTAMLICAGTCAAGGLLAAALIRNPRRVPAEPSAEAPPVPIPVPGAPPPPAPAPARPPDYADRVRPRISCPVDAPGLR